MKTENIKLFRLENKLSQEHVAGVLKISQSQYSKFERGESLLNHKQIIVLCELYNCTPNDLLGFKGSLAVAIDPLFEDYKKLVEQIKK